MAWYAEKGQKHLGYKIETEVFICYGLIPEDKFTTFAEAKKWFDKNKKAAVAIWYESEDDVNDDPAKKTRYESKIFPEFVKMLKVLVGLSKKIDDLPSAPLGRKNLNCCD